MAKISKILIPVRYTLLTIILYLFVGGGPLAYSDRDMTYNSRYSFYKDMDLNRSHITFFDFFYLLKGNPILDSDGEVVKVYILDPSTHPDVIQEVRRIFGLTTGRTREMLCSTDNHNIVRFLSEYDMVRYKSRNGEKAILLMKKNSPYNSIYRKVEVKRKYQ